MNAETLKSLVDKISQVREKAFELAIRENYVTAIEEIITVIVLVVVIGCYLKALKWGFGKEEGNIYNRMYNEDLEFHYFIGGFFVVILVIVVIICFSDAVGRLVNPQWHAAQDIIGMVR